VSNCTTSANLADSVNSAAEFADASEVKSTILQARRSSRWLVAAALLALAISGCCHPCCQRPCGPCGHCSCEPGRCGPCHPNIQDQLGWVHSLFKPPRPRDIPPPTPRFHPVPARPVFEYPPELDAGHHAAPEYSGS
jgi:hypothetical protein